MTTSHAERPAVFQVLSEKLEHGFSVPANVLAALAERVAAVLTTGEVKVVDALCRDLDVALQELIDRAPQASLDAVFERGSVDPAVQAAHVIGQLGFAQLISSHISGRRAGDDFFQALEAPRFRPYLDLLFDGEMRNVDIAEALGIKVETVSRAMKVLREQGVTDFRKAGRDVCNFLSPVARATMGEHRHETLLDEEPDAAPRTFDLRHLASVRQRVEHIPEHLHSRQILSAENESSLDEEALAW
jgi:DNA-binding transcriptional ArsR family regulator